MGNKKMNGFQPAPNLDGSQIQSDTRKATYGHTQNRSKPSSAIWIAVIAVGLTTAGFYCLAPIQIPSFNDTLHSNKSETQAVTPTESPVTDSSDLSTSNAGAESDSDNMIRPVPDFYTGISAKEAADSFMADNYLYYKFISEEEEEDSYHLLYQIRNDSYFVSSFTPIILSCSKNPDLSNYDFDYTFSEPELEWHLDGEWYFSDASHNYYLKINRCEGATMYAEYLFLKMNDPNGEAGDIAYTQSSDGEITLQIVPDSNDDTHYYTTGDIKMDIYPFGITPDAAESGIGISIDGIWLEPYDES